LRAGPLADADVIAEINRHFVPVFVSNEDYAKDSPAPAEEKAERDRVWADALKAKLPSGTVHVYLLDPGGRVLDSMHVAEAAKPGKLLALLKAVAEREKTPAGDAVVKPAPQSACPKCEADALVLHLVARGAGKGSWREFPAENWIVLGKDDWARFLPPKDAKPGQSWDVDRETAAKVLTYFYPQTENNDVSTNRIDRASLKATVVSVKDGVARARLDGSLKMKHAFYPHRDDDKVVEATVVGYVDADPARPRVRVLRMVTDEATYGAERFEAALREAP